MPDEFEQVLVGTTSRAFKFSCPKNSGSASFKPKTCTSSSNPEHILVSTFLQTIPGFIFRFGIFRPSYYQLALSYSPTLNLSYGIILSKTADHSFPLLLSSLKSHQTHSTHPLLTAALLSKIVST
jgi:hypothetical protein